MWSMFKPKLTIVTYYENPDFKLFKNYVKNITKLNTDIIIFSIESDKKHKKYLDIIPEAKVYETSYLESIEILKGIKTDYIIEVQPEDELVSLPKLNKKYDIIFPFNVSVNLIDFMLNNNTKGIIYKKDIFIKEKKIILGLVKLKKWVVLSHWMYYNVITTYDNIAQADIVYNPHQKLIKNTKIYDTFLLWCYENNNHHLYQEIQTQLENKLKNVD